jgi:hypothetical protein
VRRNWTLLLLVFLLLAGVGTGIYFYSQRERGPVLPIPATSEVVVGINVSSLTKIFVRDYLFHRSEYDQLLTQFQESEGQPPLLDDLMGNGLRLKGILLAYRFPHPSQTGKSCWALPMWIEDKSSFESWVNSTAKKESLSQMQESEFPWVYSDRLLMGLIYRNNTALFLSGLSREEFAREGSKQLTQTTEEAMPADRENLDLFLARMKEASIGSWHQAPTPEKSIWHTFVQHFYFQRGAVRQEARLSPNPDYDGPLLQASKLPQNQQGLLTMETRFHPDWLSLEGKLDEGGLAIPGPLSDFLPQLQGWNGSLNLSVSGWQKVQQSYTTYDFDDNFNRIPVRQQKEVKLPALALALEMRSPAALTDQLARWRQQNQLVTEGEVSYFQIDSSYRFVAQAQEEVLVLSSEVNAAPLDSPLQTMADTASVLRFRADLKQLFAPLDNESDLPFELPMWQGLIELGEEASLDLQAEQDQVTGKGELKLNDRSRNALPLLLLRLLPQISLPM